MQSHPKCGPDADLPNATTTPIRTRPVLRCRVFGRVGPRTPHRFVRSVSDAAGQPTAARIDDRIRGFSVRGAQR